MTTAAQREALWWAIGAIARTPEEADVLMAVIRERNAAEAVLVVVRGQLPETTEQAVSSLLAKIEKPA